MQTLPQLREARINGDLQRPEIVIQPRLDLAANLGVTTSALSQAIRTIRRVLGDDSREPRFVALLKQMQLA